MKKLFVHLPLFRLLSPLFSGVLVYLLILLINNNVEQLQDQFLGEELYVCIGLSFIIQEVSRGLLLVFKKLPNHLSFVVAMLIQIVTSLILTLIVVTFCIHLYYKYALGYAPNNDELWLFNSIFVTVAFIYILLNLSHHYLYKVNTKKMNDELSRRQMVEEDFIQFRNEINPVLLFDSLESILVLSKQDKNKVDHLIDAIASTYRYVLSKGNRQLVDAEEELKAAKNLVQLFNYLPYRKLKLSVSGSSQFLMVPGSLLKLIETIVRTSIISKNTMLVNVSETEKSLNITYNFNDKIVKPFTLQSIEELQRIYAIYSNDSIRVLENENQRTIKLPKLNVIS